MPIVRFAAYGSRFRRIVRYGLMIWLGRFLDLKRLTPRQGKSYGTSFAPKIEESVSEARFFWIFLLAENREGQLGSRGLDGQFLNSKLHLTGRDRHVDGVLASLNDLTRDGYHAL